MNAPSLPLNVAALPPALATLHHFVEDELLRAPLLFDQIVDGCVDALRREMPVAAPEERSMLAALTQGLRQHRGAMSTYFVHALREQALQELQHSHLQPVHRNPSGPSALPADVFSLVDEDEVAVDVALARIVQTVRNLAEHELQELRTYVAALVGDMDVAHDYNPLRPEGYARALWAAAHGLTLPRDALMLFMRLAGTPLAQALRMGFAGSCSRLEGMGVEPAGFRTVILGTGSRAGVPGTHSTISPDLHGLGRIIPATLDDEDETPLDFRQAATAARKAAEPLPWQEVAQQATSPDQSQGVELVSRLFDAILDDDRVPQDMQALIEALHLPALRLTLRDASLLDQDRHPLWRFVNRLAYEAEMAPDSADPERARLFKVAGATIEQIRRDPNPGPALFIWADGRLDTFLQQRLVRRLSRLAGQVAALQKLEDRLCDSGPGPTSLSGTLDVAQLDTVPASLVAQPRPDADLTAAEDWLNALRPGDWVRMFIQGRWVRAQLLWPGERQEVWLFGDGASEDTWAVRRRALLGMHGGALMKTLRQRSLVRSAAARLQLQLKESQRA
jgi:hypothetical protein